jgi:UDP-N-acetylmuramoyl-L-alanyl-D-glutamate--2,6-diaminopimelate ligase
LDDICKGHPPPVLRGKRKGFRMRLGEVVKAIQPVAFLQGNSDVEISGINLDSRRVGPGELFAALSGTKSDGGTFARQAAERGAAAILTEHPTPLTDLPQLVVKDARLAAATAARTFYGQPDRTLKMGAITGTNGKSTTAYLVRHLLGSVGMRCGLLGTIEYDLGVSRIPAPMTTPDAPELFAGLKTMHESGCKACILEASSHSLCQHRLEGIRFDAAGFTNLTQDHLDYHRTMNEYREAKAILFRELAPSAVAAINLDDPAGQYYAKLTRARVVGFSQKGSRKAELRAKVKSMDIHGTRFFLESPWGKREMHWGLVGEHNLQNALVSIGLALGLSEGANSTFSFDRALKAIERFPGVPGRLEAVGDGLGPFRVLVDYAHTDDALRNVLTALRQLRPSRVIAVFGCGGDRDKTKRPKMGRVVEDLADMGILTSDNPRSENPRTILAEIYAGIQNRAKFSVEEDRAKAIDLAIREARSGDVVLIAGKGHEDYQIVGTEKRHFDDREQARIAMQRRFGTQHAAS